jgi:multidrug resistance efflux pump
MSFAQQSKLWLGRKSVRGAVVVVILVIAIIIFTSGNNEEVVETAAKNTEVAVITPVQYVGEQSLSLIGNVRAFSEVRVTSEKAGRVTGVNVSLGEQVAAGTVIASLENAIERASVLQAEGSYEAALAASAQSGVAIDEANTEVIRAKNTTLTEVRSSYNTINSVVVSDIDPFFNQPLSPAPKLIIAGKGYTRQLEIQRVTFENTLKNWKEYLDTLTTDSDLQTALETSEENVQSVLSMVDTFLIVFKEDNNVARTNQFTVLRTSILNTLSQLDDAETGLKSGKELVKRAELAASGGITSSADAQIKQALGTLRAAQANLAKTILRTPISGTVNSLSIRTGDFINSFVQVAVVANNNALEVITYIGDAEVALLSEGDSVLIEGSIEGIVTEIAPAVDNETRKTEVRIATEDAGITNGDTVRITKVVSSEALIESIIRVPLTAVKFDQENGSLFVVEDNTLVAKPVVLGNILGGSVEIIEGITTEDAFVIDVRGLIAGDNVDIKE